MPRRDVVREGEKIKEWRGDDEHHDVGKVLFFGTEKQQDLRRREKGNQTSPVTLLRCCCLWAEEDPAYLVPVG